MKRESCHDNRHNTVKASHLARWAGAWLARVEGKARRCKRQPADRLAANRSIVPLSELAPGAAGQIASIEFSNAGWLGKLMAMGVLPGEPIICVRRSPAFVFESGYSQFAVDRDIAAAIFVQVA